MNKQELEKAYCNAINSIRNIEHKIKLLKKTLEEDSKLFREGLAEDSDYNDGVKAFLNHYIGVFNKLFKSNIEPTLETKVFVVDFGEENKDD